MRKIYACDNVLNYFENANQKIKDKLKFVLSYIADEKHPLCEPYIKHISIGKYSLFYELRIKVAKEIIRVIFHIADNDIVLLYTFCKNDRRDTNKHLESAYRLFENKAFTKTEVCMTGSTIK